MSKISRWIAWSLGVIGSITSILSFFSISSATLRGTTMPRIGWLILAIVLYIFPFIGMWFEFHCLGKRKQLIRRSRQILDEYIELMRCFPESPAVLSPFSFVWRPLIGTTNPGLDVLRTIDWHKQCVAFLDELSAYLGASIADKLILNAHKIIAVMRSEAMISQFDCIAGLREIERVLLIKLLGKNLFH
jgi:hypothetical protein